jgi:hypothetical protein
MRNDDPDVWDDDSPITSQHREDGRNFANALNDAIAKRNATKAKQRQDETAEVRACFADREGTTVGGKT